MNSTLFGTAQIFPFARVLSAQSKYNFPGKVRKNTHTYKNVYGSSESALGSSLKDIWWWFFPSP